jgi:hypothetical protein
VGNGNAGQFRRGSESRQRSRAAIEKPEPAFRCVHHLAEHFREHGKEAIERVFREKPSGDLDVVAKVIPKQVEPLGPENAFAKMTEAELDAWIEDAYAIELRNQTH